MKNYLNTLNEREKWMVITAALAMILYAYYFFLYSPLSSGVAQKSAQLIEKSETLSWMKKVRLQAHSGQGKQSVDNSQLLTLFANQLKDNPAFKTYQIQQTGSGDIQITFDDVPFNLFMAWLIQINDKYAFTIKQFDASKLPTAGMAKLMLITTAGA